MALSAGTSWGSEGGGPKVPGYLKLPKLVVNLSGDRRPHFIQVMIQAYVETPECLEAVETNMPVLSNESIMMISGKPYKEALAVTASETWRAELLRRMQQKLKSLSGETCISELVFSDFIVQ